MYVSLLYNFSISWHEAIVLWQVWLFVHIFNLIFLSPEPFVEYKDGEEVNGFNLEHEGFRKPIIVPNTLGLRMKVPPPNFTLHDVVKYTKPNISIDVIDVAKQTDMKMTLREFVSRFYAKPRGRVLNVLSFEYSRTKWVDLFLQFTLALDDNSRNKICAAEVIFRVIIWMFYNW